MDCANIYPLDAKWADFKKYNLDNWIKLNYSSFLIEQELTKPKILYFDRFLFSLNDIQNFKKLIHEKPENLLEIEKKLCRKLLFSIDEKIILNLQQFLENFGVIIPHCFYDTYTSRLMSDPYYYGDDKKIVLDLKTIKNLHHDPKKFHDNDKKRLGEFKENEMPSTQLKNAINVFAKRVGPIFSNFLKTLQEDNDPILIY